MNILMLTENDPAGMGIAFTKAINAHTDHVCRLISKQERYGINFEKDIHIADDAKTDRLDEIEFLLRSADIIHFHILSDESMTIGPFTVKDYIRGKAIVHHHHGHPDFRSNPAVYREKYRRLGRKSLVSTPDLLKLLPEALWLPNIVPVDDPRYMPNHGTENGRVRLCQSPTKTEIKNTQEFRDVSAELKHTFPETECVVIENTEYDICLSIKRSCDIHFDHMQGYYGVSSLESLSQGKPVIAGLDEWNMSHIREFTGRDHIPWRIARNIGELKERLTELISDEVLRRHVGHESREFMVNCWNEKRALDILFEVYRTL